MHFESKTASFSPNNFVTCFSIILLLVMLSTQSVSVASAAENPTVKPAATDSTNDAKRARELLDRAVAYYEEKKDKALAAFNRQGEFIQGELYVYAINTTGVLLASGGSSSALIDRIVLGLGDLDGKLIFKEILEIAQSKGSGTVEYRWLNRVDHKVERKVTYFKKVGDVIIAVGYYIPRASAEQARNLLDRASIAVKNDSKSAFKAFGDLSGKYVEDDLYVFVIGIDDLHFRAHGATPRLVGSDAKKLTDPNGKPIIQEMITIIKSKGQGELDYSWRNPVTNRIEKKHTYVRKVDNFLVGVGYYT
ncbi:MAG: cache domain-containing protein, partial [Desulfuromonadaceae bacterium]|nr:cache domain-containing protein [Desulfuromonadaceae bacterium]